MDEQVLIVGSDSRAQDMVRRGLVAAGYSVAAAHETEAGLSQAGMPGYDVVVLGPDLPGFDGPEACRRLRNEGSLVPILVLTGRDAVADRVACLEAGADDTLSLPFAVEELLARIRALLRRQRSSFGSQSLRMGDLVMNTASRQAHRGGRPLSLTTREFDLLQLFMQHPRQVLTREIIYDHIWGYDFGGESNIIEVYIRNVRAKLEARGEARLLHTVRGVGYALRAE